MEKNLVEVVGTTHHAGCKECSPIVRVVHADQSKDKDSGRHCKNLRPSANTRTEQRQIWRETEHIAMDVLPPCLLRLFRCNTMSFSYLCHRQLDANKMYQVLLLVTATATVPAKGLGA